MNSIKYALSSAVAIAFLTILPQHSHAMQYGGVLESFGGDISNPNQTFSLRGYYLSDPSEYLGVFSGRLYSALSANLTGNDYIGTIGIQNPLFNYGPRAYSLQYGLKYLLYAKQYSAKPVLYAGLDYTEALTLGTYLNFQANILAPSMFQSSNIGLQLSFGIKYFVDSEGPPTEITRIKPLNIDQVLATHTELRHGELEEDLSADIQRFTDISESTGISIPKFVYRGRAFTLKRTYEKNADIVRVWGKAENISKTFAFQKTSGNTWVSTITLPNNFQGSQINITIYSKSSKGAVKSEFTTTVVE